MGRQARILEALLADTEIKLVPVVHEGRMLGEDELRLVVQHPSRFYEGPVGWVYVKVEKGGRSREGRWCARTSSLGTNIGRNALSG